MQREALTFEKPAELDLQAVSDFVTESELPSGLVGIDVAYADDRYFVIEENYAPEWRAADAALVVDRRDSRRSTTRRGVRPQCLSCWRRFVESASYTIGSRSSPSDFVRMST